MSITKLLYGDCMEWLPKLPVGQTSLILADLPNMMEAEYDKNIIPLPELWQEYKRILKPGGIVALFASQPFTTKLINSNPTWLKNCWYWEKVQPMRRIEEILIFQDPNAVHKAIRYQNKIDNFIYAANQFKETANSKRVHPSQKPVALLEYIIKTYTKPGELIVDNTMGSGSTGVAAINTGRGFIGIELDGGYYNAAVKRIKEVKQQKQQEAAKGSTDEKPAGRRVTESDTQPKEITLGSLFDGLGGWQIAAIRNGVKPLWSSEIEAFPMAITKKHFPDTLQLGDITKLDGAIVPPVDIICAGSPCFVTGTSIQTKDGIKPIENIVVGDMVIADDCGWHKVVEIMRNQTESVYTIKAQGLLELEATGNHPFLVKHMKRYCPTKNGKRCNLRKFSKAEWVKVENLQKGDFVGYPILQTSENVMSITKEEAWLIGRYIADGYTNNSQRQGRPLGQKNHKVIYCIGKGKLDNFKSKIKNITFVIKKM